MHIHNVLIVFADNKIVIFSDFSNSWATQENTFEMFLLTPEGTEFGVIAEKFFKTMPNAEIMSIEKIQNRVLWRKYSDRAEQIREESQNCQEKLLFHGTSSTDPNSLFPRDLPRRFQF